MVNNLKIVEIYFKALELFKKAPLFYLVAGAADQSLTLWINYNLPSIFFIFGILIQLAFQQFVFSIVAIKLRSQVTRQQFTMHKAVQETFDKFSRLYVNMLIAIFKILLGFLMLIVPGIKRCFELIFVGYATIYEDPTTDVFLLSKNTIANHHLKLFWIICLNLVFMAIVGAIFFDFGNKAAEFAVGTLASTIFKLTLGVLYFRLTARIT